MFFVLSSHLLTKISPLEIFSSIISILGHDVAHPGVTNRYLINNKDELALQFNDISVLENMHSATIFSTMRKSGSDILSGLCQEDWFRVRSLIIQMVLATDMSRHFEVLGQFRARVFGLKDLELNDSDDKTLILSFGLKCADLGHSAKSTDLHKKWSFLVCDELFTQGDLEKEKFQTVSMYCDRETTDIDKSQSGFLKNICIPLYEVWGVYMNSPTVQKNCIDQQMANQKFWEDRAKYRKSTMRLDIVLESALPSIQRMSSDPLIK